MATQKGLIIAAPRSASGKTMITLGLLRALRDRKVDVRSAKSGPDYIDPQFHAAASGNPCVNLDAWAMPPDQLRATASGQGGELLIVEGAMGLFDGAPDDDPMGKGSVADLAAILDLPVVLVLEASHQAQTAAVLVQGLANYRNDVRIAGVILNRVGSERHVDMLTRAIATTGIPVLGAVPRSDRLDTPSRHLGLVQPGERPDLVKFIKKAASLVAEHVDLQALLGLAADVTPAQSAPRLSPLGQRIAVARDEAFGFVYPHILSDWQRQGAEIRVFSPLANEAPDPSVDAIYLPGGYPELHARTLTMNRAFRDGMVSARERGTLIYGECGGYMVLGETLTDGGGITYPMLGFLPVSTSFETPKFHLGYRHLTPEPVLPWGPLKGHEFHYATVTKSEPGRLFSAKGAIGNPLPDMGHINGRVCGSFAHVIALSQTGS